MRNKIIFAFFIILSIYVLTGCGSKNSSNSFSNIDIDEDGEEYIENDPSKMTKEEIESRLISISNDLTDLWNDVICEISWYSKTGKSSTGKTLDIDFVVNNSKKYYDQVIKDKEFIDKLGDDYSDIKEAYDKAVEQATIIYDNIQKETPKPNEQLSYMDNIDLFNQYQMYFWKNAF